MLAPKGSSSEERELRAKRAMRRAVIYIVFLAIVVIAITRPDLIFRYLP